MACANALCFAALTCTCSSTPNEEDEEETNIYLGEGAKIIPSNGSITVKKIREFYGNNSGVVLSLEPIPKSMDRPLSGKGRRISATIRLSPKSLGWYKIDHVFW